MADFTSNNKLSRPTAKDVYLTSEDAGRSRLIEKALAVAEVTRSWENDNWAYNAFMAARARSAIYGVGAYTKPMHTNPKNCGLKFSGIAAEAGAVAGVNGIAIQPSFNP
ncbi:MAG TPA: hypothetical protein V6C58_12905 [Allocoleopsis sp.]